MLRLCYAIGSTSVATFKKYTFSSPLSWLQITLWTILFLTNLIDVLGSWYAFSLGCDELNPLMNLIYESYGMNGITLYKSFWLFVTLLLLRHLKGWIMGLFALCCFMYSGLAAMHITYLIRAFV